jgi:UDP-2,3-diacylglucosamine hydrolase
VLAPLVYHVRMILFVSDLHLDGAAPAAIEQFIGLLRGEARQAGALYILGDLFESWIGDDDPDPDRDRVCAALRELTESGVPCFVMVGNRDFLLGEGFERRSGCRLLPDPCIAELDGERVLLTHGDLLCTDDHAYQELRTTVRSSSWQQRVLALPLATRALLAGAARAGSRSHVQRVAPQIMDVNPEAVTKLVRDSGVRWLIHGHTHRPAMHRFTVDGREVVRAVLDAWYEHGQLLAWENGALSARDLPRAP